MNPSGRVISRTRNELFRPLLAGGVLVPDPLVLPQRLPKL